MHLFRKSGQRCSANHVKEMDFNPLDGQIGKKPGRFQHHPAVFTGKPQNDVSADIQAEVVGQTDHLFKTGDGMPPVDGLKGFVVSRLQAVLHPNQIILSVVADHFQDFFIDAIGPCAHRKTHHVRMT